MAQLEGGGPEGQVAQKKSKKGVKNAFQAILSQSHCVIWHKQIFFFIEGFPKESFVFTL